MFWTTGPSLWVQIMMQAEFTGTIPQLINRVHLSNFNFTSKLPIKLPNNTISCVQEELKRVFFPTSLYRLHKWTPLDQKCLHHIQTNILIYILIQKHQWSYCREYCKDDRSCLSWRQICRLGNKYPPNSEGLILKQHPELVRTFSAVCPHDKRSFTGTLHLWKHSFPHLISELFCRCRSWHPHFMTYSWRTSHTSKCPSYHWYTAVICTAHTSNNFTSMTVGYFNTKEVNPVVLLMQQKASLAASFNFS